jgi:hypothetical protein
VLDPNASLWALLSNPFAGASSAHRRSTGKEKEIHAQIKDTWGAIRKEMIYDGIDFDNLDAEIMMGGEVRGGKICVGRAEYGVLVLPPLMCIESKAAAMIREFVKQGGKAIYVGFKPSVDIDGDFAYDAELVELERVNEAVKPYTDDTVSVSYDEKYAKTLLVTRRYDAEGALYVYVSNQENNFVDVTLTINKTEPHYFASVSFEDGLYTKVPVIGNKTVITFKPFDLKVLKLLDGEYTAVAAALSELVIDTDVEMDVSIAGENVLPFDTFEFSADKVKWINRRQPIGCNGVRGE